MSVSHLTESPQETGVGHGDDGEGYGKTKEKVHEDVGHVPNVTIVPTGGTGSLYSLQLITSPTKQRWSVPHEGPHPGQHHSCHCMSEENRGWDSACAGGAIKFFYAV